MEALPTTSREGSYRSMGSLPRVDIDISGDELDDDKPVVPSRRIFREGHGSWSGYGGNFSPIYDCEDVDIATPTAFKRASLLRRSICAIRKSVNRHQRRRLQDATENSGFGYDTVRSLPIDEGSVESTVVHEDTCKAKKSKWKRFFPFRLKRVHPTRSSGKGDHTPSGPLCVYTGFGRTFERIHPGEEIAIAVFGKRGVGKTSLLDIATLSCEGRRGIAPLGLTERMRLGGKSNHSEYRFAHMTSMTVQACHQLFVIDLIDAEFEDDHSVAHTSYMRAADAAILLYSCSDSASLLTAMSIHRQLAAVSESRKPCVLMANVLEGTTQRFVSREMGEKTARNIRATYIETNLLLQDGHVFEAVEQLSRAVVAKRKSADVKDICAVM